MKSIYKDKIATSTLNIKQAIAGKKTNAILSIKIGEYGIADGGVIKILFRISSDIDDIQFTNSSLENYVKLTSSNKNIILTGYSRSNGLRGKVHARPWTNGFYIFVKNGYLLKGETLNIVFVNLRMQTIVEDTFEFKTVVDAFATGEYIELESNPEIKVIPDKPSKLRLVAQTLTQPKQKTKVLIKLEDKWGNPCTNLSGKFLITNNQQLNIKNKQVAFKKGKANLSLDFQEGTHFIRAKYGNLTSVSNPIVVKNLKRTYTGQIYMDNQKKLSAQIP